MEENKSVDGQPDSTDPTKPADAPADGYVFGLPSQSAAFPEAADPSVSIEPSVPGGSATPAQAHEPPKESYADLPSTNLPAVVATSPSPALGVLSPGGALPPTSGATVPPNGAPEKFAVDEVVTFGWKSMLTYFWPLTGVLTCNGLIGAVPVITSMVLNYSTNTNAALTMFSFIVSLVGGVVACIIQFGTFNLWLKVVDGDTVAIRDVYSKYKRTWNYALASFVYGLMVGAGYICLIIPGIYLQIRFQFYPYFIIESDASPMTALKASWAISKGSLAELFFLLVVNYFIGWVGMLCLLVGTYPAHMVQTIALAKTYRLLRKNTPVSDMPPNLMPAALISDTAPPMQPAV